MQKLWIYFYKISLYNSHELILKFAAILHDWSDDSSKLLRHLAIIVILHKKTLISNELNRFIYQFLYDNLIKFRSTFTFYFWVLKDVSKFKSLLFL